MNSPPQTSSSTSDPVATDLRRAKSLLGKLRLGKPVVALLSTVSPAGYPHVTWMFASRSDAPGLELLFITSPDSDKVENIRPHPEVEWLLTSSDRLHQLYLRSKAEQVEKISEIRRLWNLIEEKDRLPFVKYYNSGMGFAIVRCPIHSVMFNAPEEHRKTPFKVEQLIA